MRDVLPAMAALLQGYQFFAADLYSITFANGSSLLYTSGDGDITIGGYFPAPTELSAAYSGLVYYPTTITESATHYYVGVDAGYGHPAPNNGGFYAIDKATGVATKIGSTGIGDGTRSLIYAEGAVYGGGIPYNNAGCLFRVSADDLTITSVGMSCISVACDGQTIWALVAENSTGQYVYQFDLDLTFINVQHINTVYGSWPLYDLAQHIYHDDGVIWVNVDVADGIYKITDNNTDYIKYTVACDHLAFTPTHIWATKTSTGEVKKINKIDGTVEATYTGLSSPAHILYISALAMVAIACQPDQIVYMSVIDGSIVDTATVYSNPKQMLYSNGQLLVTSYAQHKVSGLSASSTPPEGYTPIPETTWYATPFSIGRGDIGHSTGVSVDECQVTVYSKPDNLINGLTLQNLALIGGFDNARIAIDLAVMPVYGDTSTGIISLFDGRVTDVNMDNAKVELTISAETILLDTQIPTILYQPSCVHSVYSTACGANRASFSENAAVTLATNTTSLAFSSAQGSGFYLFGKITFTSGVNNGLSRAISNSSSGSGTVSITMGEPLPFTPSIGDTFTISAGCDKTRATCTARFSNAVHFLAWEDMPVPEASV